MSIYSCNISNVSRAKGSSSCATLSYITAEKIREERTGNLYNYGRNERVLYTGTIIPFYTSGGSLAGNSQAKLQRIYKHAKVEEPINMNKKTQ